MPEEDDPQAGKKRSSRWVTRAEAGAVLILTLVFLVWTTVVVVRQRRTGEGIEVVHGRADEFVYLVDVNAAGAADLRLLPGIGEVRAERIIAWRNEQGPFQDVEELKEAAGLSERDMKRLRGLVTLGQKR